MGNVFLVVDFFLHLPWDSNPIFAFLEIGASEENKMTKVCWMLRI